MAIFFGDELKSANSKFPIIDIAENNAKGVVFVDGLSEFTSVNIPYQKITVGMLLVDRSSGNVYIYAGDGFTNSDSTTGNNNPDETTTLSTPNGAGTNDFFSITGNPDWKTIGNTPTFPDDFYVNIPEGNTFGKYENQDLLPWDGRTALEAIQDALTSYQEFDASDIAFLTGNASTFDFKIAARSDQQSLDRKFKVRNRNRSSIPSDATPSTTGPVNFGIRKISIEKSNFPATNAFGSVQWNSNTSEWEGSGIFDGTLDSEGNPSDIYDADGFTSIKNSIIALNSFSSTANDYVTVTFDDKNVDIPSRSSGSCLYNIKVIAQNDEGDAQAEVSHQSTAGETNSCFSVDPYQDPTITVTVTNTSPSSIAGHLGYGFGGLQRVPGDIESTISVTVTNTSGLNEDNTIQVSSIALQRQVSAPGGAPGNWENIHGYGGTFVDENSAAIPIPTALNSGTYSTTFSINDDVVASNFTGNQEGEEMTTYNLRRVSYRCIVTDNGASATNDTNSVQRNVIVYLPIAIGYSTQNPVAQAGGVIASAVNNILLDTGVQPKQKKVEVSGSGTGTPTAAAVATAGALNGSTPLSIPGGSFVYVALPKNGTISDCTDGSTNIYNDLGGAAGRGTSAVNVEFENSQVYEYQVYANAVPGAPYPELDITAP